VTFPLEKEDLGKKRKRKRKFRSPRTKYGIMWLGQGMEEGERMDRGRKARAIRWKVEDISGY
jgi:hypothetical protein